MSQTENFPNAASIEEAAARYFDDDIHAAYEEQEGRVHVGVGRLLLQRRLPNGSTEQYRADAVEAYVLDEHGQSAGHAIEPLPDQEFSVSRSPGPRISRGRGRSSTASRACGGRHARVRCGRKIGL